MDVDTTTLSDRLGLDSIIAGIAGDLQALRENKISVREADSRARLAHEIMRGIDLIIKGQNLMMQRAKQIPGETA